MTPRAAALVAILAMTSACGIDTPASCVGGDLAPLARSEREVRPVLARACALGGCHLRAPGAGELVLDTSSPAWVDAVVGVPSRQRRGMELVAAGAPQDSWLMHKIDGCSEGPMPPDGSLGAADRAVIVGWIAAGAPR